MLHTLNAPGIPLAILLAALVSAAGWGLRWLTPDGAVAACLVGGPLYAIGGGPALLPLMLFFVSGSLLSKLARRTLGKGKGDRRTWRQVAANGGVPLLISLCFLQVRSHWPVYRLEPLQLLFLASLAAVTADTWATEIGALSRQKPYSLRTGKLAEPGISGAVSPAGTLGSLAGAFFIPLASLPLWHLNMAEIMVVGWAGFLGSGIDSLLGAGLQARYADSKSKKITEEPKGPEGAPNVLLHGLRMVNNDVVNFLACAGGALAAFLLMQYARAFFLM